MLENPTLKHKSVENLHVEIFHDNVTFNQSLVRKLGTVEKILAIYNNVRLCS